MRITFPEDMTLSERLAACLRIEEMLFEERERVERETRHGEISCDDCLKHIREEHGPRLRMIAVEIQRLKHAARSGQIWNGKIEDIIKED